jgi:hypothetical protein
MVGFEESLEYLRMAGNLVLYPEESVLIAMPPDIESQTGSLP